MVFGSAQGSDPCQELERDKKEVKGSGKAHLGSGQHPKERDRRKWGQASERQADPTEPHGGS